MCGISGILHKDGSLVDLHLLQKMNRTLTHRGPDDEGYFIKGPVGLAQRRLSIIDLSSGGHQPMATPDGRYTLTFNGEIYNYQEIKKDLQAKGYSFKSYSDTEVLLTLLATEGMEALQKLNGMFAFALWDAFKEELILVRDRFGKKPLYVWETPSLFAFASEPKAFLQHPQFSKNISKEALKAYFQYENIPSQLCIFEGVKKIPAGNYYVYQKGKGELKQYWNPRFSPIHPVSEKEACSKIVELLDSSVKRRMISDVPLGVFLSGGLDSSSIVAMMARHREGRDIKTFSINFNEKSFDESEYSSLIAKQFNTDHYEEFLTPQKMIHILPEIASFMDEPFADYSIIPTTLLSRFTRQKVTVALGGDGSDEIFAGYPTFHAGLVAEKYQAIPGFIKAALRDLINSLPVSTKDMSFEFKLKQFIYGADFPAVLRNQVWLGALHQEEMQNLFLPEFSGGIDPLLEVKESLKNCDSVHLGDQMLYFYQKFYLTDDILVKTDRASMSASLEVRAPYLDVDLAEYVNALPYSYKQRGRQTKYILKKALEKILPHNIIYRPKKGFGIPIALWLKNELKPMLLETLHFEKIKREGIFNPQEVNRLISDHLNGKKNNRKPLFALLMFELWLETHQWV